MPYITSTERLSREEGLQEGLEKGRREGLLQAIVALLRLRFPTEADSLLTEILTIQDVALLESICTAIVTAENTEQLRQLWTNN